MRTIILFLLIIKVGIFSLFAQKPHKEVDSLKAVIGGVLPDSLKAETLFTLGKRYRQINFDSARYYYGQALEIQVRLLNHERVATILTDIAISFGMQSNYPEALYYFRKAYEQYDRAGDIKGIIRSHNNLGIVYKRIGDYASAFDEYNTVLEMAIQVRDSNYIVGMYRDIGVLYDLMGNKEEAIRLIKKSMSLSSPDKYPTVYFSALSSLGILYSNVGKYDSAEYFLKEFIEFNRGKDRSDVISGLTNLANLYLDIDKVELALLTLREAQSELNGLELPQEEGQILFNFALANQKLGNHEKALNFIENAQRIFDRIGNKRQSMETHELASEILEKLGRNEEALERFKQFKAVSDSLFSEAKRAEFETQKSKMDILEKDAEIREQEFQVKILESKVEMDQKLRWVMGIAALLLSLSLLLLYQRYTGKQKMNRVLQKKNQIIVEQKEKIEQINQELENRMLRAQMNPHFIFNSLSSIQHFIMEDDRLSAMRYLAIFSKLLRSILETSIDYLVPLKREIDLLEGYLQLETLRFDGKFEYSLQVSEDIDLEDIEVPIVLFQPFVENAILHGLLPSEREKKSLMIAFEKNGELFTCKIKDNGIGRKAAGELNEKKDNKHRSEGLKITAKRLAKYNQELETQAIEYNDLYDSDGKSAGTEVLIKLQIKQ